MTIEREAGDTSRKGELPADAFEVFFLEVERRLTVALVARYGAEVGREAAVDALAWAWENWERLRTMENSAGYLYRVGQTAAGRKRRLWGSGAAVPDAPNGDHDHDDGDVRLDAALATLSRRQRQVTVLVHAYGFTHREAGDLLGISPSSVQNHAERGVAKLRQHLEATP